MEQTTISSVFSTDPAGGIVSNDLVTRRGKVFEIGTWPDRGLTVTAADLDAAAAAFTGADLDLEHFRHLGHPSIFDGKLGRLTRVWRDGTNLLGEVQIPPWVDTVWAEAGRKISTAWDIGSKRLLPTLAAGLVLDPAVADAAMFSADPAAFAGSRHNARDQYALDMAAQHLQAAGATPPRHMAMYAKETPMSWFDELRGLMSRAPAEVVATAGTVTALQPVQGFTGTVETMVSGVAASTAFAQQQADLVARERAQTEREATFARQQFQSKAELETARLLQAKPSLVPVNQPNASGTPALTALFAQALAVDAHSAAVFGAGSPASTLFADLVAAFERVPTGVQTDELLPSTDPTKPLFAVPASKAQSAGAVLPVDQPTPDGQTPSPERIAHLKAVGGPITNGRKEQ